MAHELRRRTGTMPTARDIARLLSSEFSYVRTDAEAAKRRGLALASRLAGLPPGVVDECQQQSLRDHIVQLRYLSPENALVVEFGDSSEQTVSVLVLPNESIKFGYRSTEEEERVYSLVSRCAAALRCELVRI